MPKFYGKVTSVGVKGYGINSALLQFTVSDGKKSEAFVVRDEPAFKAQVFSSMAALLSAAYFAKEIVGIEFTVRKGETPDATNVFVPAIGIGKKKSKNRKSHRAGAD